MLVFMFACHHIFSESLRRSCYFQIISGVVTVLFELLVIAVAVSLIRERIPCKDLNNFGQLQLQELIGTSNVQGPSKTLHTQRHSWGINFRLIT